MEDVEDKIMKRGQEAERMEEREIGQEAERREERETSVGVRESERRL